ncbi:molybdopterin-binding protein [Desulfofalx alkaliphila]|uniref:molybdopterin-binding protein n=1 Tax=Desulfofalx alkaliphila TaxID=105483 RepID=UPI0004E0BF0B|nr:molybdopterin-binding protein [Desulfofalx alkaliphila]
MRTEIIKVEEAVGKVLCHDITKIVKGSFKGPAFKKGHVLKQEDIQELLNMGKEHVYVLELEPGDVHEDDAGIRLAKSVAGSGVEWKGPKEGRVNLFAAVPGLLKVNVGALESINDLSDVILATLPNNSVVEKGNMLAGTKVIPLVVKETVITAAEEIAEASGEVIRVLPFIKKNVGIIVTGSEVYKGRIKDAFGPGLSEKVKSFGSDVLELVYAPDKADDISQKIKNLIEKGAELIMVSGGMSVDPDDVTPTGIRLSGAEIIKYGAPALPGAMFMLAYLKDVPVFGVPACGMFFKTTILDILLPKVLTGEIITRKDLVKLANGGLCRSCDQCRYPNCSFGTGASF